LLRIKVKLSNDSNSNLLCYKKPWYQGKNPNLAAKKLSQLVFRVTEQFLPKLWPK
jgi:hypothetical protein